MDGAAAARDPICWFDFVAVRREGAPDDRGVLMKTMPRNMLGVMRADGAMVAARWQDLSAVDRSYLRRGHVVAAASDPGGQIGVVTGVATALDVARSGGGGGRERQATAAARGVSPAGLRRVTEPSLGDYVVSGPWLGRVVEVSLDVDVLFDDGALCRITRAEHRLEAADQDHLTRDDTNCVVLYPGQRVAGCPSSSSVFKASRWIKGYWKPTRATGTVAKVDTAGVVVYWLASVQLLGIQASAPPHAYHPSPRKLGIFRSTAVEPSEWCVGDRCFFRTPRGGHKRGAATDAVGAPPAPARGRLMRSHGKRTRIGIERALMRRSHAESFERAMYVADTRTTVDVLWQDGTRQCGVPSTSLIIFKARNDHDFIPGQHVVGRTPPADNTPGDVDAHVVTDEPAAAAARFGVVRSLDSKNQTVCVSWFKVATCPAAAGATQADCCEEETVSAYDLARNLDEDFFYGDVVIRLRPAARSSKKKSAHDLSWVGDIVDLCDDGHVRVKWGNGNTSKVLPHEIAVVKHQSVSEMLLEIGDWMYDDEDMAQKDTTQQPTIATDNNDSVEGDEEDSGGETDLEAGPEATRTTDRSRAVVRALFRRASEVFAQGKRYLLIGDTPTAAAGGDEKAEADATGDDGTFGFRHFDVAQSPPDHHFLDNMEQGTAIGRKWTKRVQREWKILENDLPDTIYMRVFEDRMDLLRAVMVGASGTPYHDGLFFFDLHLPPSYPAEPPQVNYRSFGLHVNPNLYPSGTVCLSLLNTFGGKGAELWSPEVSSVLQVVVSIQGLVLTAQPYYNEPAYGAQSGTPVGRRNELPYSENAYLLTLQTMLHLLRRPPAGFEEFVTGHFRRRGQHVLRACEAYMEGCLVGTLDGEACLTEGSKERLCSAGFRLALHNVLPRLVEAFAGIGAQGCEQFHKFEAPSRSIGNLLSSSP
ncbi:unnamed protein product [Urochloa decumbens]|uniref:UBC core domain-containing protein n=1 Tax=Urochloa decumbens TaxID=240449 RepID=A0ABC8Y1E9_9POAL